MSKYERVPELGDSLNYLLKHATQRTTAAVDAALAPLGIDGRELGALVVVAGPDALSQQQVAERLGVDRTSMVGLVDGLETKGIVVRRPSPDDRRRNMVELTAAGRRTFRRALQAREMAEAGLLEPLGVRGGEQLRRLLAVLVGPDRPSR